ncbi:pyridoxal kinase PdxY [Spirochaetia bacterium]|nr:pyridoxal kinase PdxY [Spirochaetia bacterium]
MAILSIQSHVVYGYAGNAAAVFPLQRLGREVWAVNTVEFSNHTGYGAWRGKVLEPGLAEELVAGIADRGVLANCEAVLSGYMGDAGVGRAVIGAVQKVKSANPKAIYCCDPVMGDVGRGFYVHADIPAMFKNEVIPCADITTPNQFELEAITGMDTSTLANARKAIDQLHAAGPKVVLVTSFREKGGRTSGSIENHIDMLASDGSSCYRIRTPELPLGQGMAGSGDVTTALFLSRYLETGNVRDTLELTAGSIFGIMDATYKAKSRELRTIQAQGELVKPSHTFTAEKL